MPLTMPSLNVTDPALLLGYLLVMLALGGLLWIMCSPTMDVWGGALLAILSILLLFAGITILMDGPPVIVLN